MCRLIGTCDAQKQAEDLDSLGRRLSEIEQKLESATQCVKDLKTSSINRFENIESKLNLIADAVGVKGTDKSQEDAEDRKRLKERLKEALEQSTRSRRKNSDDEKENWIEYIFGICNPDGRVGKAGSR